MADQPTLLVSVRRALHLLDAVGSGGDRPITAKALARATGEALPTTYHLLRTLVHEGYLSREDGGYVLGPRARALSQPGLEGMRRRVWPALRCLHDDLAAASYLAVYRDGEITLVDVVDSPGSPRVDLWVGLEGPGALAVSVPPQRLPRVLGRTHELSRTAKLVELELSR